MEEQILSETLRIGDKLPYIRTIQKIYNASLNTARQTFLELESKSLIESRPKAGYYVSKTSQRKLALPSISKPNSSEKDNTLEGLTHKVFDTPRKKDIRQFSLGVSDESLLPIAKLNKGVIRAMRNLDGSGTAFEPARSINLRRNNAKWSLELEGKLTEDDILTTLGTMNAIFYCLNAVKNLEIP
ncbi:GntR family transcriptional regulator [Pedobacter antarcticus]|uniref:GntR family transcriptional regulator n=1 Tax=Pedobacter antarcticus TaxID=34086 RepID=UPI002931013A|nr:GntR family transcriptional regulator [Pedobacter antarcticus]